MTSTVRLGAVCFGVFAFVFLADFMFASHRFTSRAVLSPHAAVSAFVDQQQRPDAGGFAKRVLKADAEQQQQRPLDPSLHGDYRRAKMDDYTSKRTAQCDEGGGWQSVDMPRSGIFATSLYGNRTVKPESGYPEEERYVGLQVCETFDDASEESGWKIYRIGPMVGMGGSDWHQVWLHPIPHPEQAKFITGKVTGPVDERGNFLGHPPIYSHHVHVEVNGVQHCIEAHGDTTCSEEKGGTACYLRSYPEGYGLPFNPNLPDGKADYIALDFMLNDLREFPAPPMVFYEEIALKWSAREDVKEMSTATMHMSSGGSPHPHPFSTTMVTRRPGFLWSTSRWMVDGKLIVSQQDHFPWFHAHRKFMQGAWAFAATPEDLGLTHALLKVVDDNVNPHQPTAHNDLIWNPEVEDPVQALMDRVAASKAGLESLRCWMLDSEEEKGLEFVNGTDASRAYPEAWHQNWIEGWYDRAGEFHCDEWSFAKGEPYTVVSLNGLDDRVPDLGLYTQHGAFLAAYEPTGDQIGPTLEVYGAYKESQDSTLYVFQHNWSPKEMNGIPYELLPEELRADNKALNELYIQNEFGVDRVQMQGRDYDGETAFFINGRTHKYYDDAMAELERKKNHGPAK